MGMLSNLKTDETIKENGDSIGSKFSVWDSDLYRVKIKLAYLTQSIGEAIALNLHCENTDGNNIRQQFWIQSGKAKKHKNYYKDKDGNKQYLPGFTQANNLCQLLTDKNLSEMVTEQKVVDLYDPSVKAMAATTVEMLTELLDKEIVAGVVKQKVNKNAKHPETGKWVPTAEVRFENEIDKFFNVKNGMTLTEIKAGAEKATFKDTWLGHYKDKVKDRTVSEDKIVTITKADTSSETLFA